MRDPDRIPKILDAIKEVWEMNPDLRFSQLLLNLGSEFNYWTEDNQLVRRLKVIYQEIEIDK